MQRLEVSGAVRPLQGSLGVKGLIKIVMLRLIHVTDMQPGVTCKKVGAKCCKLC